MAVAVGLAAALAAHFIVPVRAPRRWIVGLAWLTALVALAGHALADAQWLEPVIVQARGQTTLLIVRLGLLFGALAALRGAPKRAVVVVPLFVGSLALRAGLPVFLAAALITIASAETVAERVDRAASIVMGTSLVAAAALAASALLVPPPSRTPGKPDENDNACSIGLSKIGELAT